MYDNEIYDYVAHFRVGTNFCGNDDVRHLYDCINTIYQVISPFLDNKMSIFMGNMEPLS